MIIYRVDALRADRLSTYGHPRPTSPELDDFASRATSYERAYAQSSWTRPAVASIFTGLRPEVHGANRRKDRLGPGPATLAELLSGAGYRTVHVEACAHLHRVLQAIRATGMRPGVALNPHSPVFCITEVLSDLDLVLIMSVNPGFGGQSFIPQSLDKLRRTRELLDARGASQVQIEVDGGVKLDNAREIAAAGADILVSGSGIFGAQDVSETVREFTRLTATPA